MIKDKALARKLIPFAQTRMKTLNDFVDLVKPFTEQIELHLTDEQKEVARELFIRFKRISNWKYENLYVEIRHLCISRHVNMKVIYKALTGNEEGLPLADTFRILGKEKTLARLKEAIK